MPDLLPRKGMSEAEIASAIDGLLDQASLTEKVAMMSGRGFFAQFKASGGRWGADKYRAGGGLDRLGLEPFYFTDGPRGVAAGESTCFPCSMARGASFDPELERRIGEAMGIEIRAQGRTLSGAVCINLLRHPAWGRAQETYGEDPFHVGVMGAALAQGIQTHNVVATVKHFALNSVENTRFKIDVRIDARALREIYLPHFKRVLDAGCASVMSAYNKVNGVYCGESRELLTDILRHEWGFDGFVHSDWIYGVYSVHGASAGLDVENPEPRVFGDHLIKAVQDGHVAPGVVEAACRRILTVAYRFAAAQDPLTAYPLGLVACEDHRHLAREAAEQTAVLMKNDGVLPLARDRIKTLAVLGRLAALANTGDHGSSRVAAPYVVTAVEGLSAYLGATAIVTGDESDLDAAVHATAQADALIVVVGLTAREEGEFIPGDMTLGQEAGVKKRTPQGGDRQDLNLPDTQLALIAMAAATSKPLVVVIVAGSAILVEPFVDQAGAILQTFYSGMEGGHALARILFGEVGPSGRLPFTLARQACDYPFFDSKAEVITYGLHHGYWHLAREGATPRYSFGHGLDYTSFTLRALKARRVGMRIEAQVTIVNLGKRAGTAVAQFYVAPPGHVIERPGKMLKAFVKRAVEPGAGATVHASIDLEDLKYWDPNLGAWRLEPGRHRLFAAASADDPDALFVDLAL